MTYIGYLNRFHLWLEDARPTDKTIVLYYNLLQMFNRRGWPQWAGADTQRLLVLARTSNRKTACQARDALVEAGFIEMRSGRKGRATEYRLTDGESSPVQEPVHGSVQESAHKPVRESATPNKIKNKTKTIEIPPAPTGWGSVLTAAFTDWLAYKQERRQPYHPTGYNALIGQISMYAARCGEAAVAGLLRLCMANGWQGIVWDKLDQKPARKNSWMELAEELDREEELF